MLRLTSEAFFLPKELTDLQKVTYQHWLHHRESPRWISPAIKTCPTALPSCEPPWNINQTGNAQCLLLFIKGLCSNHSSTPVLFSAHHRSPNYHLIDTATTHATGINNYTPLSHPHPTSPHLSSRTQPHSTTPQHLHPQTSSSAALVETRAAPDVGDRF